MVMFSVRAVALRPGAGAQQNTSIQNISMHFFFLITIKSLNIKSLIFKCSPFLLIKKIV